MNILQPYIEKLLQGFGLNDQMAYISTLILMLVCTLLIACICDWISRRILLPLVHSLVSKTKNNYDDVLFSDAVLRKACHIVPALVVWGLLPDVFSDYPLVREWIARLTAIYITVMAVRFCLEFIDALRSLQFTDNVSKHQYMKSFCDVLRIVVVCIAIIIIVGILVNRSPFTLVAGLGAASAVLMLVFKDTIAGLVAGIRLTSANMLHPDDWITVPSANANGKVIDVNLTTVKVRNFDNTIITISPTTLVSGSFQNWSYMQQAEVAGRRVAKKIMFDTRSIRRATPALKQELCEKGYFRPEELEGEVMNLQLLRTYVERWLHTRPEVVTDGSCEIMVRDLESTEVGLQVEFYFFLKNKKWRLYEHDSALITEWIYAFINDFHLSVYVRR